MILLHSLLRDVAQSGLEYSSGGRVVAGSNPVIPTLKIKDLQFLLWVFFLMEPNLKDYPTH